MPCVWQDIHPINQPSLDNILHQEVHGVSQGGEGESEASCKGVKENRWAAQDRKWRTKESEGKYEAHLAASVRKARRY
jgi:hypothetical protein